MSLQNLIYVIESSISLGKVIARTKTATAKIRFLTNE